MVIIITRIFYPKVQGHKFLEYWYYICIKFSEVGCCLLYGFNMHLEPNETKHLFHS